VINKSKPKLIWHPSQPVEAIINTHWPSSDKPESATEEHLFSKRMQRMQYDLLVQHIPEMDGETRERAMRNLAELERQLSAT